MVVATTHSGWQSLKNGHEDYLMSGFGASLTTLSGSGWRLHFRSRGEVAEWFKAAVLKTVEAERLPGVRIPSSPPDFARAAARASSAPGLTARPRKRSVVALRKSCRAEARAACEGGQYPATCPLPSLILNVRGRVAERPSRTPSRRICVLPVARRCSRATTSTQHVAR